MALAHLWIQNISRAKSSLPASVAVHYLKREAEFAAEAYLSRTSEQTKDRNDLRAWGMQNLPPWAEENPAKFFSAAEQHEGVNRYHAIMLQFSLPKEMTHEQHMALTEDFIEATMSDKPLLWVKHEPLDKFTHAPQPHIHVLLSARTVDGIARDPRQTFQRWNAAHPERGGCQKDLFWSRRQGVEQLRHAFTDLTNMHAERLGLEMRIDSRSLRRRDIDRKPMYTEEDRPSREALAAEQLKAADAWEQRKAYKGIEDISAISREEIVLLVRQWTRDYVKGKAVQRSSRDVVDAWYAREVARREAELATLETAHHTVQRARQGEQVSSRDLLAALAAGEEHGPRRGLTMHLTEERTYGR
jgi:hypothetical protein